MKIDHRSSVSAGLATSAVAAILTLAIAQTGAAHAADAGEASGAASGAAPSATATAAAGDPAQSSGGPAAAETAGAPTELQEVRVSGYRSSLAEALNIKRNMGVQADTILAEDIGKFPDQNLAESLQRVPGVAI